MYINPTKSLKKSFLNFVRYFYDPKLTYTEILIRKWIKQFVPFFITIFLTGLVFYIVLSGFVFIFPKSSPYIFLGTTYMYIPLVILYLGLIRWFFEDLYKFIMTKLKGIIHVEVNIRK